MKRHFSDLGRSPSPQRTELQAPARLAPRGRYASVVPMATVVRRSRCTARILLALLVALISFAPRALAQDQAKPAVSVAAVIQAQTAAMTSLPIRIGPAQLIPRQAFVRIRGLPRTVALSEGYSIAAGAWAVPLSALPRLRIEVPTGTEGTSEITILLVSVDGAVLHEAKSTLLIVAGEQAAAPSQPVAPAPKASTLRVQPDAGPPVALNQTSQLAAEDRDRALKMMQRGNELIASKDFSAAQHFYKRAADIGLPEAALALARTYDPGELARVGAVGLRPDPEMARNWYEKARVLGSTEDDEYLLRLSAVR